MAAPDKNVSSALGVLSWISAALVVVGLSLGLLTILFLGSEVRRELDAVAGANSDSTQWTLSQTEVELSDFRSTLLTESSRVEPDLDRVRLVFDVLYSRFTILMSGDQFRDLRALPEMEPLVTRFREYLDRSAAIIDTDDAELRASLPLLMGETQAVADPLRSFILRAIEFFSDDSDRKRALLHKTLAWMAYLTATIVLAMFVMIIVLVWMFRRARLLARDREEARNRLEAIIATSMDAVLVVGENGRILEFNGAAERVFGRRVDDVVGRNMADVIVPEHMREAHLNGMARYNKSGVPNLIGKGLIQIEALRGDGTIFPVEMSIAEAETTDGRVFVSFLRDITSRLAAQSELIVARDKAVAGEQAKADLVAVMSHEMRTPLNGVLGALDLLMQTSLDRRQRDYADVIRQSGSLLKRHIDDVLDMSRLDASKMTFTSAVFSLNRLLQDAVEIQEGFAASRGNSLTVRTTPQDDAYAMGDAVRLQQVLLNLIGNAIKFTRNGRIDIECERLDASDMVEFRIADDGIGIPEDQHTRIFDEFVTIDATYGRTAEGTGLGLAITRRLVAAMGGEIGLESEPGVGSLFWFRLPLPKASPQTCAEVAPALSDSEAERGRDGAQGSFEVLLVEDNPINRMIAREMLIAEGGTVFEANNGSEAVRMAEVRAFDLIVTDISMPEMDGIEATRLIRASSGKNRTTPVVTLTAHAFPTDIARFEEAGIEITLTKPVSRDDIRRMLERVLPDKTESQPEEPGRILVDGDVLMSLHDLVGTARFRLMLSRFEDQTEEMLGNRVEAPPDDVSSACWAERLHKLSGSAAVFGATEMHAWLSRLEADLLSGARTDISNSDIHSLTEIWRETRAELNGRTEFCHERP